MDQIQLGALLKLPLFATLTHEAQARLQAQTFIQSQPAEAILFEQGETAQFLHVILSGRVALVGSAPAIDGPSANAARPPVEREAIIEMFGAGDVVTAAAILLDLPYMMSARIIAPSRIAFIPAALIRDFFENEVNFSKAVALMLARHWRLLSRQLKDQKLRSGTQRLGGYLLSLSDGRMNGMAEIEMPVDRRTLASWLGMSAENLSRSLAQLKTMGVHVSGRRAQIDDIVQIRSFCLEDDLR
ncbi:helix-turn-helix domain-containing protein [Dongia sp.]|jgi:CRP/FNR family transcriptional activator FtrB|uniref:helix-turn-helix domain-containing protein n=1 Tax=Dongia sp. TaxID=1977262 RepID=UPI0035AFE7B1